MAVDTIQDDDGLQHLKQVSRIKHIILQKYLPSWELILGSKNRRLCYFDCYAGPGVYEFEGQKVDGSPIRAFEFFQGVPKLVVPDNTKTGVSRACRYEPDLNPAYQEMAQHYGVGVLPARPYRPRDKAKVENAVQLVERWIVAALRHRKFFSLADLNQAIRELLEKLNQRRFRKREGSRATLFAELDQPALQPLPLERFQLHHWAQVRVNIDYHVQFDRHFYSVPYTLTGGRVEIRSTATIQRWTIWTPTSALALSRGFRGRAGSTATP